MSWLGRLWQFLLDESGISKGVFVPLGISVALITGTAIYDQTVTPPPPPGVVTANVWLSTVGSDASCTRSATPALSNAITACATWQVACNKAQPGDSVAVQSGVWSNPNAQSLYINSDCSKGSGNSVNWNTSPYADLSRTTNWVTFKCGDNNAFNAVQTALNGFTLTGDEHVIFDGGPNECFYFRGGAHAGQNGSSAFTSDIVYKNVHFEGIKVNGASNVLYLNSEIGPSIKCGKVDPNVPAVIQCNPNGPYWEAQWANFGPTIAAGACPGRGNGSTGSTACGGSSGSGQIFEPIIGTNLGGAAAVGSRMEGNWIHDQQVKDVGKWHPGCVLFFDTRTSAAHSFVFTRNVCERQAVQMVQFEAAKGIDVTNNYFGVPLLPCEQDTTCLGDAANGQQSIVFKSCTGSPCGAWTASNDIVAYNTQQRPISIPNGPIIYSNVLIIGNLQLQGGGTNCSQSGITYISNYGAGCTSGPTTSDVVQAGQDDGNFFQDYPPRIMNLDLTGGTKAWENVIAASSGGLDQNIDVHAITRSDPRTAGAQQR